MQMNITLIHNILNINILEITQLNRFWSNLTQIVRITLALCYTYVRSKGLENIISNYLFPIDLCL